MREHHRVDPVALVVPNTTFCGPCTSSGSNTRKLGSCVQPNFQDTDAESLSWQIGSVFCIVKHAPETQSIALSVLKGLKVGSLIVSSSKCVDCLFFLCGVFHSAESCLPARRDLTTGHARIKLNRASLFSPLSSPAFLALSTSNTLQGSFSAADASAPRTRNPAKALLPKLSAVTLHRHPDSSIGAEASANKARVSSLEAGAYLV
ncbi:Uncharacterized protein HZ326_28982 [Fusarium oxysporum f. sp. albedinis]|nr:Uncharacterized protein HZ326_28982 [Fusarium oxysporum f. sp. albedinis]